MYNILVVVEVVLSILLILAVLLQQKGAGLSATFGGSGGFHASKRGADKFLHNASVVLVALFILNSLAFLFV